ncbi:MAG: MlaD family protein [Alphaproteobacteria bacterium]
MRRNVVETVMGAVVLVVAALFLAFAYTFTGASVDEGAHYELWAKFDRVDGLQVGDDVTIAGIKVGTIKKLEINKDNFLAHIRWTVRDGVKIAADSEAEIVSESLLGGMYMAIHPGSGDTYLANGDQVRRTLPAFSLERLIGEAIFSKPELQE